MNFTQKFSYKKATQSINFFASKQEGIIDKLKALKLIYFADRYHLRKYGRLITNDAYFAMDYGPVASGTKDILEMSTFLTKTEKEYALRFIVPIASTNDIKAINAIDESELSASEFEALNYVSDKFQKYDSIKLSKITHEYPDWKKNENQLVSGQATRIEMDLFDFFDDPEKNDVDRLYPLPAEEKQAKIEYLMELNSIDQFWNQ